MESSRARDDSHRGKIDGVLNGGDLQSRISRVYRVAVSRVSIRSDC